MTSEYMISRIPGFYAAAEGEEFTSILDYPRWQRFFRWTRRPIPFRLTAEEESKLPRLSAVKPSIAICPHHHGLACKALPVDTINKVLGLLRERLDAEYYIFDEQAEAGSFDAPWIGGLNLTQAMVLMGRFDAAISVDSWQKYILGMHGKPQTALVVDFRRNESYTYDAPPEAIYQEFFRWRMRPEGILGFEKGFTAFRWKSASEVEPEVVAGHLLGQVAGRERFAKWMR